MIVVAGEALVDLIPTPAGSLAIHPGGGPFNTARWLGRLGADVAFLGSIAADPLGQRLRDELVATGVVVDLVAASELPTTLALAQLDESGAARYSFYTERTSAADLAVDRVALPASLDALYLGGLGLVLEPIGSTLAGAVALARERGALVMLDPNVRPSLIADRDAYLSRLFAVVAQTDVLKLSTEDVAWLSPGEPPRAAARALLERGPSVVLLTAGAAGATVFTAAAAAGTTVPAVQVDVVDTIGAGDAFSAGFLSRWLAPWGTFCPTGTESPPAHVPAQALVEATAFATRVAALACTLPGATPPPTLDTLPAPGA